MRKHLSWILILFAMIYGGNVMAYQKDPCTTMAGFWTGDFSDRNKNCKCTSFYQVRQENENVSFDLMQYRCDAGCDVIPPDFQGMCRGMGFTSTDKNGFRGIVWENRIELDNEYYKLDLYR